MKRRNRLRFVSRATSNRFELLRAGSFGKATPSVALHTLRDNGHGSELAKPLECDAGRRFHFFPKGAALSRIMGEDAIHRFLDFI